MTHRPATRAEAKRLGLKRYNTGMSCKHGHISDRTTGDGKCCECNRLKSNRQREEDPEKVRGFGKRWREQNKDANQLRWREYYDKNREKLVARNLERKKEQPERYALYQRVRLYRARGASDCVDYRALKSKLIENQNCNYCGNDENLTIDHILPISRGGSNELSNLQVLCSSCNGSKQAKTHDEYMEYLEALNGTYTRE